MRILYVYFVYTNFLSIYLFSTRFIGYIYFDLTGLANLKRNNKIWSNELFLPVIWKINVTKYSKVFDGCKNAKFMVKEINNTFTITSCKLSKTLCKQDQAICIIVLERISSDIILNLPSNQCQTYVAFRQNFKNSLHYER